MPPLGRDLVKYERIPSEEELPGGATRETLMQAWVEAAGRRLLSEAVRTSKTPHGYYLLIAQWKKVTTIFA